MISSPHAIRETEHVGASESASRYKLISDQLAYEGSSILYLEEDKTHRIDLSELVLPPTTGCPRPLRFSEEPAYVDLALALADRRVAFSRASGGVPRAITRQLYLARHVLDWLRSRGIYRLAEATEAHTLEMAREFAAGGWTGALRIVERWHRVIDTISPDELAGGFHTYKKNGGVSHIETLVSSFWRERIGWGGLIPMPPEIKTRLDGMLPAPAGDAWRTRRTLTEPAPGRNVVRNVLTLINDWACLPETVDRFRHRLAETTISVAAKFSSKVPTRTANLPAHQAIGIITAALRMQYVAAPLLLELFEVARHANLNGKAELPSAWLKQQEPAKKLGELIGKPIERWVWNGHHAKREDALSIDQVLGAVQSACAIVLTAMNARRQREVCDDRFGVRVGDLNVLDDEAGIYLSEFYIEKTYFDRHSFYINRTSADAMRCLEALKKCCLPFGATLNRGASLFSCGRRAEHGIGREVHMSFAGGRNRARSLTSFFEVALDLRDINADVTAHMFRRFYAVLYFHQYEHADLRALKQHLRHLDVAMTRVYCTDPSSRKLAESIRLTLGRDRFTVADARLHSALDLIDADIETMMDEVGKEKLHQAVEQILNGNPTGGGFSRVVGKLYRQMLPRTSFLQTETVSAASRITQQLVEHGYRVHPMQHGQCHAPETRRHLKPKCDRAGSLAREHARPDVCHSCAYHFNNEPYLQNLREDLDRLEADAHNILLPPLTQMKAEFDLRNLRQLVFQVETEMQKNSLAMKLLVSTGATRS